MSILDYPETVCEICHGNTWWHSSLEPKWGGPAGWVCGTCHPPFGDVFTKMRIIKGNYILNKMRDQISSEDLLNGIALLKQLWGELPGPNPPCLYIEGKQKLKKCVPAFHNQKGIECFSCRNDYWWSVELWEVRPKTEPKPVPPKEPTQSSLGGF